LDFGAVLHFPAANAGLDRAIETATKKRMVLIKKISKASRCEIHYPSFLTVA
jgi:GTP cyclohydrolase I